MKAKNDLRIIWGLLIFISWVISCSAQTSGPSMTPQELIAKTIKNYQGLHQLSMRGEFMAESPSPLGQAKTTVPFSLDFQRPNKIAFKLEEDQTGFLIVCDAKDIYLSLEGLKEYTKSPAPEALNKEALASSYPEAWRMLTLLSINHFILSANPDTEIFGENYEATSSDAKVVNNVACYGLTIAPAESLLGIQGVTLYVGKEDFLIRQLELELSHPSGTSARLTEKISQLKTEPVSAQAFEFKPSADAKLVKRFSILGLEETKLDKAHNFKLKDLTGKDHELTDYKGKKVVVLNFWATWCGPCIQEMPMIEKFYRKYKEKDVVVLGINNDQDVGRAESLVQRLNLSFPILLDSQGTVSGLYKITSIPRTIVIDKQGEIVEDFTGMIPEYILVEAIKKTGVGENQESRIKNQN